MSVRDIDSHKLQYHPERIAEWTKNNFCYPLHIEAGITNRCNHKCTYCTLDWINHKTDNIDTNVFLNMLDNAKKIGVKSIYFAGEGEPTLHKDLPIFVKSAHDLGIKVSLSTNGSLLKKELAREIIPYLSWMRFSVDAFTKETYSKLHGVGLNEFDKVLENIKGSVSINTNGCQIGIQALFMPDNLNEIEDLAKYSKSIGVDNIQIKPAHSHPKSSYQPGIYQFSYGELQSRLEKLSDDKFTAIVRVQSLERLTQGRDFKKCHAFNVYCLIDAYGNVTPCNVFYSEADYIFGNIYKNTLEEVWNSEQKKRVVDKITSLNFSKCGDYRCRLDVMNRYLERVKNPEINDEFI